MKETTIPCTDGQDFSSRIACFETIFDSLSEGIMAHGPDRRVFYFSRGAEKITGAKKEAVVGRDCHSLFIPRLCGERCAFLENADAARLSQPCFPTVFTAPDSARKELDITRFPMKNGCGGVAGAVVLLNDRTRLHELEEKLARTQSAPGKAGRKPKLSADAVERALVKAGGNKAKAARSLRVGRATLYNFLNEHALIKESV